jgi:2-dehydro-3-deoxyphosphogluconate aldolase/(4S)-4-hydroxy-2-oxoglutarate aldolase
MISKEDLPLLGILRGITEKDIQPLTEIFIRHEVRHIEITMNTKNATLLITEFIETGGADLNIGAGTVLNRKELDKALDAGAKFIVSPSIVNDVIEECVSRNIPVFPGALTPTEIHKAWVAGATMVKLFPASLFGAGYVRAVKAPFDDIKVIAVGGVGPQNISKFFDNGADAVAFGAGIIRHKWLEENKYDLIEQHLKSLIEAYKKQGSEY